MAMYKSNAYNYVKYFQMLTVREMEKLFQNNLEKDVLLNFWNHIQLNHPTEVIKEEVVERFAKERSQSFLKPDYWIGIIF